ncbi:putative peptidyl-prolyl cis-trans isomerase D [Luminiphilus syltensis NOR5-1B]|uniref:Periplasmic chaperone PpiD n=2 Tax=Luminiphilus TaxID=1341118 RepID=B8KQX4_9GAMM|nr:putative peptidyl-prolyl cis-trans isomerase D [Luminiphilus syltensis NOR5-1B]
MREGAKSTAAKIVIGLIVLSFAAFGLESLLPGGSGTSVAEVNGEEISPAELQNAIASQKRQLTQIFGDRIDPAMLDDERIRPSALEGLIERKLLLQHAVDLGMIASAQAIGEEITAIEAFQRDGVFSPDQYKSVLANAGLTPERFRRMQSQDLMLSQLQGAISQSAFVSPSEMEAAAKVWAEERDVRYLEAPLSDFDRPDSVDEAEIAEYYDNNQDRFVTEPAANVGYILLAVEDFYEPVDEALVREQFEAVRDEYEVADQSRVSHILIIESDEDSDTSYADRVGEVARRLDAGEDFGQLAMELSDDVGSAGSGGELGFTDGTAFPEPMEEAIASLSVGAYSGPVETDAGTHFIRVEERVAGERPDFATLREELEQAIKISNAERDLLLAVDELKDLTFNAPDLIGPAEALGFSVAEEEELTRSNGVGVWADERVVDTVFSEEVYRGGNNSEVLELADSQFLVVRVNEQIPARQKPLQDVAGEIAAQLKTEARTAALTDFTEMVSQRLAAGETLEAIANELGYEWRVELAAQRNNTSLPREVLSTAFVMSDADSSAVELVELPGETIAVVQLARIREGDLQRMPNNAREQLQRQLASAGARIDLAEYVRALRQEAEIVVR